jgi:HAD superfamily hydrolase (TIGR01484 family)
MKNIREFKNKIQLLLTDIDDTMTDEGLLGREAYDAMWRLRNGGIHVVPVTGRPAGWCELIARLWPVSGVIGENGGFYFRYINKQMKRHFFFDEKTQKKNREKLDVIHDEVLKSVKGSAIASDQFCRLMDLAIDFCEDVPRLPKNEVQKIVQIFEKHGAHAKISSIHVNGWFGDYDKLTQSLNFLANEFGLDKDQARKQCAFAGDSPNDEPMWSFFPNALSVANITEFLSDLKNKPKYVSDHRGGLGFAEIADQILDNL